MAADNILDKLAILADAAKYDASCASSGTTRRDSRKGGIGSTEGMGICHAYTPDGRCISLLKILLTNSCIYDCLYCINRASSSVQRARFTVREVVDLTLGFYRRNCIEGLFLSSGIIRSPDYTMEQLVLVAKTLREDYGFKGYIHLKTIPDADPELLDRAGRYADRLSINIELPAASSLAALAPEKDFGGITTTMGRIRERLDRDKADGARSHRRRTRFAPAGQSTQLVVGAEASPDRTILGLATDLYARQKLRRVYYSAYSPIPDSSPALPARPAPLAREHRLYQSDWLLRFYGFTLGELPMDDAGNLPLEHDPKLAWAIAHRTEFPLDVNRAPREMLLRVPGFGVRSVKRILAIRRDRSLDLDDLARLRVPLVRARPFIVARGHHPGKALDAAVIAAAPAQLSLF